MGKTFNILSCDGQLSPISIEPINQQNRFTVCEWMYQICERLFSSREDARRLFHLSVHFLDRLLYLSPATSHKDLAIVLQANSFLQLIGLCCVFISLKRLIDINYFVNKLPSVDKFFRFIKDGLYDIQDYHVLLYEIEKILQYEPHGTCYDTFEILQSTLSILTGNTSPQFDLICRYALVLLDSFVLEKPSHCHSPDDIAYCSFLVSETTIIKKTQPLTPDGFNTQCFNDIYRIAYNLFNKT